MKDRPIEHIFFFAAFALVGYLIWEIILPFVGVLALAAIIATVCAPLYERVLKITPRNSPTAAALISVVTIACTVFVPLFILAYVLFIQALAFYDRVNSHGIRFSESLDNFERMISGIAPGVSIDLATYAQEAAGWLASHMGTIFAGTASTVLLLFIMLVALFYFLRDGKEFTVQLVRLSPLPDDEDQYILKRLGLSVRSVVMGTLAVALVQGVLTSIGFWIFDIRQPVLWGSVAAIGALIPGVGTSTFFAATIVFLLLGGYYGAAIGILIWAVVAIGTIDHLLGPYIMSRGGALHPFLILLSVLGGIALFGPVGLLIGPVALSLFMVLLELYNVHVKDATHARSSIS